MDNITNSQIANNGSKISKSKNKNSNSKLIKKVRTESIIISFIVGFIASLLASYIYENFIK
ncbi:hypothetical protein LNQ49_19135 [Flavobacterium sp. F-65]|uniref:Uncharacterized protein n=1 Tax=Flavobacterium pisciphilum TaxID=2893755 RepID=A0ABS8MY85_9FLAO|nr:hypothetical protein [Flavobacterium sp. F-65]MCC9073698.1 hypothetical protein [Flavobacterium sp. F-65]